VDECERYGVTDHKIRISGHSSALRAERSAVVRFVDGIRRACVLNDRLCVIMLISPETQLLPPRYRNIFARLVIREVSDITELVRSRS